MNVEPDRFNLLVTFDLPVVTLSTHLDTVPPFIPSREDDDNIWGRGACDVKGIIASMIFGFHLGAIFSGIMILLMAGYILYQTSLVMAHFPPTGYVAAALMLFSTIATLFWYVLRLLMELNSNR